MKQGEKCMKVIQWLLLWIAFGACCCAAAPLDETRFDQKLALQLWQKESVDELNKLMEGYQAQFVAEPGYERAMSYLFAVFDDESEGKDAFMEAWIKKYPKSYSAHIVRGVVFQRRAWSARGGDFAYKVSDDEFREMAALLPTARASLTAAIKLSSRPNEAYAQLIDLAMLDGGRREADRLLGEANQRFPNNYYPNRTYMKHLRPQWNGSIEEMNAFRAAYTKRGVETWKTNCMEALVLDQKVWKTTMAFADEKSLRDEAITLCPTAIRYVQRAHLYRKANNERAEATDLENALTINPGNSYALSRVGMKKLIARDASGYALCRAAALNNSGPGYRCVAFAMSHGLGVTRDPNNAIAHLKRAATRLDNGAINDFATYYAEGTWVPKNESKALQLTVIAAERGVVSAKQRLEKMSFTEREPFLSARRLQERLRVRLGVSARDKSFKDEIAEVLKDIAEPK
jgi:Domain of unknown function (DUF4034)/Sel1 repeat